MANYSIGRAPGNDIFFPNSNVSGQHADLIDQGNGYYTLVDHSMNGTYVNGQFVHNSSITVSRGAVIIFAGSAQLNWDMIPGPYTPPATGEMAPNAIPAMILGILGMTIPFLSFVGSIMPLFIGLALSIVALCLGAGGHRRVRKEPQRYIKGIGMLVTGKILGIIGVCVWGLCTLTVIILAISIGSIEFYDLFDPYYY